MPKLLSSRIAGIGPFWHQRRQIGFRNPLGTRDIIYEQLYSSFFPTEFWESGLTDSDPSIHGGVFCLEFSPEGSILVGAYERRSVLLFDPLNYKGIHTIENAHHDCVNCVKFLDSKTFATCSDDFTVALWDARNLSKKVCSFKGHTNWVKNIEYSADDGLLVTSGFDGNVLSWEMNKSREGGMPYTKLFGTNGLMRTCLTPDASKMIMCTTGGYLIVIHNLDLNTLSQDMDGFKPNMYRLMQLSQTLLPIASDFTPLFRGYGRRNRVEFITDFPVGDDAEVVSSLQPHPDGHSVISRNVSNGEMSEWSCIHNIEERFSSDESEDSDYDEDGFEGFESPDWSGYSTSISTTPSYIIQHAHTQNERSRARVERTGNEERDLSVSPADVWEALVAIQEARVRRERDRIPELLARPVFRQQMPDAGSILVRPIHSGPEGRIFETRLPQNPNSGGLERGSQSRSHNDGISEGPSHIQEETGTRLRRSVPARLRYCSLYRRSLVGQFDRTSISRRPAYRPRFTNLRCRELPTPPPTLQTNYEVNETQRIQNEVLRNENAQPSVDGLNENENNNFGNNNTEGASQEYSASGNGQNTSESGDSDRANSNEAAVSSESDVRNSEAAGSSSEATNSTSDPAPTQSQSNNERTILMGVFRAGNEGGTRGTSMRRHNVAAVTVSSTPQRSFESMDSFDLVRATSTSSFNDFSSPAQPWSFVPVNRNIHQNIRRLTHYIEEPNRGKGFIKEVSISPDGRVICSPYGNGIRLLAFSPTVQDLLHCYPNGAAIPLHEISLNMAHTDTVLSTRFSPVHKILVSGCLSGKIVFYQPLF